MSKPCELTPASDISLPWDGDIQVDECGDILFVGGDDATTQGIVRRLLTTPQFVAENGVSPAVPDYIWHPEYGGGVRAIVGLTVTPELIANVQTRIQDQLRQEAQLDNTTMPAIQVTALPDGIAVNITYASLTGGLVLVPQIEITS